MASPAALDTLEMGAAVGRVVCQLKQGRAVRAGRSMLRGKRLWPGFPGNWCLLYRRLLQSGEATAQASDQQSASSSL